MKDLTPGPTIRSREVVHKNPHYEIHHVVADFGDFVKHYYVAEHGTRVGLVVTRGDDVLLVKQYRFLINRLSLEIPGGKVDGGETPEAAAARECLEETGLECRDLKPLISYLVGLDITHNQVRLYHTNRFAAVPQAKVDPQEVKEHQWVPLEECLDMVSSGEIGDSFSIIALLSYDAHLRRAR